MSGGHSGQFDLGTACGALTVLIGWRGKPGLIVPDHETEFGSSF